MLTGLEVAQSHGAELGSLQRHDLMVDPGEEASNLAVLALSQDDFENRAVASLALLVNVFDSKATFSEVDPFFQLVESLETGIASDLDFVHSADAVTWVGQFVGQFAVVGDQQQAFAVFIETTDSEKTLRFILEQIDDAWTVIRVVVCAENALGLIEQVVRATLEFQDFAIVFDRLSARINFHADISDLNAIHRDAAFEDDLFTFASRAQTGSGEVTLETHGLAGFCFWF